MRRAGLILALLVVPMARADSIQAIDSQILKGSVLPFQANVDFSLATNILNAQTVASYSGPISLKESIDSVLKAILIERDLFHVSYIGGIDYTPIPWYQSIIAIDPKASVLITPSHLDFGEVQVVPVQTPEPGVAVMMQIGAMAMFGLWALYLRAGKR